MTGKLVGRLPPLVTVAVYWPVCPSVRFERCIKLTLSPISETVKFVVKEFAVDSEFEKSLSMLEVYSTVPVLWLFDWAVSIMVPVSPGDKDV